MKTDRELELHKALHELEETQYQYDRMERQLDSMEEDALWQNRASKELNDDLFDSYPQDKKLQQILLEKEELMRQKCILERDLFQECRDNIREMRKQAADKKDDFREELQRLKAENASDGGQVEDNDNTY